MTKQPRTHQPKETDFLPNLRAASAGFSQKTRFLTKYQWLLAPAFLSRLFLGLDLNRRLNSGHLAD